MEGFCTVPPIFERNRFVFRLQYIADKQVFGQLLGIQIGIATADNVQAVGKQFGVDMMADAFLDFAIEGEMMERGFEVAVIDFFLKRCRFFRMLSISIPCHAPLVISRSRLPFRVCIIWARSLPEV